MSQNTATDIAVDIKKDIKDIKTTPKQPAQGRPPSGPQRPVSITDTGSWDRAIRWIIYGLVFLLPILFTPWTFEPLEFSKQMLLFAGVSAALIAWLLKLLVLRNWRFVKTPLDVPILVFLTVYLLASLFSVDRVASFLGFYGSFSGNFFQVLFLVLLYYLIVNNFNTLKQIKKLIQVFFLSTVIVVVYAVLQFFGLYLVRLPFAKIESFNTVGSLLMISLFSAVTVTLGLGLRSKDLFGLSGRVWKILGLIAAFIILLTVNFLFAWLAALVGILLYMVFRVAYSQQGFDIKEYLTPLVLLVVVVAFLVVQLVFPFVSLRNIFSFNLPTEVRLDYSTSAPVITGTISQQPILGSGPNTFQYAFSQHRAQDFNLSPFWNVRFDKAPSEAVEFLVGSGILGFLAFEILSIIFIVYGLYFLLRRGGTAHNLALVSFAGFAVLWVAHWFFFFNTTLAFAYWLFLAAFMATAHAAGSERVREYSFSMADSPRRTVSIVTGVSLVLVFVIVFLFFASSVYAADIFYTKGLRTAQSQENFDEAQASFERAIRLNRFRPDYYLTYGEFLTLRVNQELTRQEPNLGLIQQWLATSVNTSRAAVNLSPNNWTSWERLANLYSFARPLVAGVDRFIIESLERAVQNDPKNPILQTELGQVYRLAARSIDPAILGSGPDTDGDGLADQQEQALGADPADPDSNGNNVLDGNEVLAGLDPIASGPLSDAFLSQYIKTDPQNLLNSEEALRKAIELKPDYATAYLEFSQTLQQGNKNEQAIQTLREALETLPNNVNIKFELGRLLFNTGQLQEAVRQFQEVLTLLPTHANARFSLALSYERLGNTSRALSEYRRVLEQNPDNQTLQQKVAELEQALSQQQ